MIMVMSFINSGNELRQRQALLLLLYLVMHNTPALYKHFLSITTTDMIMVGLNGDERTIDNHNQFNINIIVAVYSSLFRNFSTSRCLSDISPL